MIPRAFAAMLVGRGETRRPRRRFADRIRFELDEGAVHPSQGHFVAEDDEAPAAAPPVVVTPTGPAQQMADELRRLVDDAGTPGDGNEFGADSDPSVAS